MTDVHLKADNSPIITRKTLRRLLNFIFKIDAEFDAFCIDQFPEIHRNFTAGMNYLQKQNLFLEQSDVDAIVNQLITSSNTSAKVLHFLSTQDKLPLSSTQGTENPYRGLSAYQFEDQKWFCGRTELIKKLYGAYQDICIWRGKPRILSLLGSSGSGKTSLVNAGLLPRIIQNTSQKAQVISLRPSNAPLDSLAASLIHCIHNELTPSAQLAECSKITSQLKNCNENNIYSGLANILRLYKEKNNSSLTIVVDQFEEIIAPNIGPTDRLAFISNLLNAASAPDLSLVIVIIMRIDFLDEFRPFSQFFDVIATSMISIAAMTRDDLREVISKPAILAGYSISSSTVERILDQSVDYIGILPHLQMALSKIWSFLMEGKSAEEALADMGGVYGAISTTAERTWQRLDVEQKAVAERIFTNLVSLGEGVRDTRRKAELSSLVAYSEPTSLVRQVVSQFSMPDSRILTITQSEIRPNEYSVELTHETVIHEWPTLTKWLMAQRDDIRLNRRIIEAAQRWQANGMPTGLLWRSPDYDILLNYQKRQGRHFSIVQHRFFISCREAKFRNRIWLFTFITLILGSLASNWFYHKFAVDARSKANNLETQLQECNKILGNCGLLKGGG